MFFLHRKVPLFILSCLAVSSILVVSNHTLAKPNPNFSSKAADPWLTPIQGYYVEKSFAEKKCHQQAKHRGVDMVTQRESAVVASAPGLVMVSAQSDQFFPGLNNLISIDHGHGFVSVYANLGTRLVETGEWVKSGQRIAMTEETNTKVKLSRTHVEVIHHGKPIDPFKVLPYVFFDLTLPPRGL